MSSSAAQPVRNHRRDVRLRIIAPVALSATLVIAVCVLLAVGAATGTLDSQQISVIMGILVTVFVALPLVILCLIPAAMLVGVAYLSGWAYAHVKTPLRAARDLAQQVEAATVQHVPKLARPLIGINARLTRWEHTVRGWLKPDGPAEKDVTRHE